jgi:hypothetical protein
LFQKIPLTGKQAAERLKNGQPRIVYYDDEEGGSCRPAPWSKARRS